MDLSCVDCGARFSRAATTGRPRIRCEACSPAQRRTPRRAKCVRCSAAFEARGNQKYCDRSCRDKDVWDRQKASNPCPGCGQPMARRSTSSSVDQKCRACRTTSDHGTYAMYKKHGCRCESCREANRVEHARWRDRRKRLGKSVKPTARRDCEQCGSGFLGRLDTGQRFCSTECAKRAQGFNGTPRDENRFRVSKRIRSEIYEDAGWKCTLCESPVRPEESVHHPRYPTLDHIVPRSRGGSDDRSNLRLACRQCNTLRGSNVDWVPVKAVA